MAKVNSSGWTSAKDALEDLLSVPIKAFFVNSPKMNRLGGQVLIESPSSELAAASRKPVRPGLDGSVTKFQFCTLEPGYIEVPKVQAIN